MPKRRWFGIVILGAAFGLPSCRSKASAKEDAGVHPIDRMYTAHKQGGGWHDPNDPSKTIPTEGLQSFCASCEMCMLDMREVAKRIPIKTDADLVPLVRWLGDDDVCVRSAAIDAVSPRLGFPSSRSVTVEDREYYEHHELVCALKRHLDARNVAYDRALFEPFMVLFTEKDFVSVIGGEWEEQVSSRSNFQALVAVSGEKVSVTRRLLDGREPDRTSSLSIEQIRYDEKYRFVVRGKFPSEVPDGGGKRRPAIEQTFAFWPVTKNVIWFTYADERAEKLSGWMKLKKKS